MLITHCQHYCAALMEITYTHPTADGANVSMGAEALSNHAFSGARFSCRGKKYLPAIRILSSDTLSDTLPIQPVNMHCNPFQEIRLHQTASMHWQAILRNQGTSNGKHPLAQ